MTFFVFKQPRRSIILIIRTPTIFILTLAVLFFSEACATTLTIKNNCPFTMRPATLTGVGQPILTGFELAPQASSSLDVPGQWSGRFWARSVFSADPSGKFVCAQETAPPVKFHAMFAGGIPPLSLTELTLGGFQGNDFCDVSLVDGFNLPLSVTPQGGAAGQEKSNSAGCPSNLNGACPPELAVKGPDGSTVACKNACLAFNQPQYCCTGEFGSLDKCPPNSYSMLFKQQCLQAYSYDYDDKTSTLTCPTGANYLGHILSMR